MIRLWLAMILLVGACGERNNVPAGAQEGTREWSIQENRQANKLEAIDITNYLKRHDLRTTTTGTGLHWSLLRDEPGEQARAGQWARVDYRVELLNGKVCYSTAEGGPESFLIEMDDVESGLHEGIQLLSPGDSAVFIIPSYRAHGLIGDLDQVPPRSTIVYHIALVALSDRAP